MAWCRYIAPVHLPPGIIRRAAPEMDPSSLSEHLLHPGNLLYGGGSIAIVNQLACILTQPQIAFIIPLGVKPEQCYNHITPNDMHTDLSCAWTGALLLFGGWVCVTFSMPLYHPPPVPTTTNQRLQASSAHSPSTSKSAGKSCSVRNSCGQHSS